MISFKSDYILLYMLAKMTHFFKVWQEDSCLIACCIKKFGGRTLIKSLLYE